jgi:hypothetical protein
MVISCVVEGVIGDDGKEASVVVTGGVTGIEGGVAVLEVDLECRGVEGEEDIDGNVVGIVNAEGECLNAEGVI